MERLGQEMRLALRLLVRAPGFSAVVIATLALGIGANTAIFTLLDQVLLRPLPVRSPGELVLLDGPGPFQGSTRGEHTFAYPAYRELRDRSQSFVGVLARAPLTLSVTTRDRSERAYGEIVSGNYFEVLGLTAAAGRLLGPADDDPAAEPVAVLSHAYWTRRFGADRSIVGQPLLVNGRALTVAGVASSGFTGAEVGVTADLFVPIALKLQMTPTWDDRENRRSRWLTVMARLRPGVSREQATLATNVVYRQVLQDDLATISDASASFRERFLAKQLALLPGARGLSRLRDSFQAPLLVLMAMVGLVLLIACGNVANLLLARASSRQRELAIRMALGARVRDIVGQMLAESLLLAGLGGVAGLLLARWAGALLLRALPDPDVARTFSSDPDLRVLAFTSVVAVLAGVVSGLLPALRLASPQVAGVLKGEATSVVGGAPLRVRQGLVVGQVGLSVLLLFGAGLFARSLHNLASLDPGFRGDRLLAFGVDPSLQGYDQGQARSLFGRLETELAAVPGVRSAAAAMTPLLTGDLWQRTLVVDGFQPGPGQNANAATDFVGAGYFATLGIELLGGREFDERDGEGAPRVAVVNEAFARHFLGGGSPLGRRFGFPRDTANAIEIVGFVRDTKTTGLRDEVRPTVYAPYRQAEALQELTFYVRVDAEEAVVAPGLRQAVARVDASLPVANLKSLQLQARESLFVERMTAALSAAFGVLAALLAAIGLYGVTAFSVSRRSREIGLRMALGAAPGQVLKLVLREVGALAGLGIALGLPAAWTVSRLLATQLFGLSPADPLSAAGAVLLIGSVALVSGYLPARRAARVDPLVALRHE
jgi:predicted permease